MYTKNKTRIDWWYELIGIREDGSYESILSCVCRSDIVTTMNHIPSENGFVEYWIRRWEHWRHNYTGIEKPYWIRSSGPYNAEHKKYKLITEEIGE